MLACLGSGTGRDGVLRAWAGDSADDVVIAQAYLAHRPVEDPAELLRVTQDVSRMRVTQAQVRALDALARHRVDDPEALLVLARVFGPARSIDVQRAVANVMLRGNYAAIASSELVAELRRKRLRGDGEEVADALLRRLEAARLRAPAHSPHAPRWPCRFTGARVGDAHTPARPAFGYAFRTAAGTRPMRRESLLHGHHILAASVVAHPPT